jgi:hypothetical protein
MVREAYTVYHTDTAAITIKMINVVGKSVEDPSRTAIEVGNTVCKGLTGSVLEALALHSTSIYPRVGTFHKSAPFTENHYTHSDPHLA